jgi:uncharacterized protein YbaR (Trm112 family)
MYTELVDTLRCPNGHEESWLVAAAYRTEGRHIMSGALGCPVCRAQYPIEGGIADFTSVAPAAAGDAGKRAVSGTGAHGDLALKLAALLDLTDANGYVVLLGDWAHVAPPLRALVPVPVLLVNPPQDAIIGDGVSAVRAGRVPVLAGSARGVALHTVPGAAPWRDDGLLASALRAVRPGGRVVAHRSLRAPADVTVLAEDESHWVATREGARPLLQIVRAPR